MVIPLKSTHRPLRRGLLVFTSGIMLAVGVSTPAQIPGEPPAPTPPAGATPPPQAQSPAAAVEQRVADWAKALETLRATAPPGSVTLQELGGVLEASIDAGERHLEALEMKSAVEARVKAIEKAAAEWKGPEGKGPYSVTEGDRYRTTLLAANDALAVAVNFRDLLNRNSETVQEKLVQTGAALRRGQDALARAVTDEAKVAARVVLELEEARLRQLAEEKEAIAVQTSGAALAIQAETLKRDLAKRQLDSLGSPLVFSQSELDRVLSSIAKSRAKLSEERQKVIRSSRATLTRRVVESGAPSRGDVLNWRMSISDSLAETWRARFAFVNAKDAVGGLRAQKQLEEFCSRASSWRTLVESRQSTVRAAIFDLEGKPKDKDDASGQAELLAEFHAIEALLQSAVEDSKELEKLPVSWGLREDAERIKKGLSGWLTSARLWSSETLSSLWNFELYTVTETVTVDGRSVTGDRAITLGKVLTLLVIVTIGYLLLRTIATRVSRRIQKRFHLEPGKDLVLRRWILGFGMVCLGLYALHYARIPLTAFAFLGGALAIGVGFGTRNLIQNFISGLLIHAEKPLRVGDVLEVGQVNGTVVKIGMRSSVIRHWDGIETLIPNSAFLESNVTNWTYSDRTLRHSVKVGVAYGTDTRAVVSILQQVAANHGQVLTQPEPQVLFEDFGESALVFCLYFWIDMTKSGRAQVASDLRFMIEKSLVEQHISLAFPQRDMHLTTETPLAIRLVGGEGAASGSSGTGKSPDT